MDNSIFTSASPTSGIARMPRTFRSAQYLRMLLVPLLLTLASCGYSVVSDEDIDALARMKSALSIASHTKLTISEAYLSTGRWPDQGLQNRLRRSYDDLSNPFTVQVGDHGVIRITFAAGFTRHPLQDRSLTLVPSAAADSVNWACVNVDAPSRYLPDHCRATAGQ